MYMWNSHANNTAMFPISDSHDMDTPIFLISPSEHRILVAFLIGIPAWPKISMKFSHHRHTVTQALLINIPRLSVEFSRLSLIGPPWTR